MWKTNANVILEKLEKSRSSISNVKLKYLDTFLLFLNMLLPIVSGKTTHKINPSFLDSFQRLLSFKIPQKGMKRSFWEMVELNGESV